MLLHTEGLLICCEMSAGFLILHAQSGQELVQKSSSALSTLSAFGGLGTLSSETAKLGYSARNLLNRVSVKQYIYNQPINGTRPKLKFTSIV